MKDKSHTSCNITLKCASRCKFRMDVKCVRHRVGTMFLNVNVFNANASHSLLNLQSRLPLMSMWNEIRTEVHHTLRPKTLKNLKQVRWIVLHKFSLFSIHHKHKYLYYKCLNLGLNSEHSNTLQFTSNIKFDT